MPPPALFAAASMSLAVADAANVADVASVANDADVAMTTSTSTSTSTHGPPAARLHSEGANNDEGWVVYNKAAA